MSFCSNCGYQIPDGYEICPSCGNYTPAAPAPVAVPAQQTPNVNYQYGGFQPQAAPAGAVVVNNYMQAPVGQLKTNRSMLKYILLGMITFGIYPLVVMCSISTDINTIASRYDGKKTMHFLVANFLLAGITMGIVPLVWSHNLCDRIGGELQRRGIDYSFGAGTFWGWGFFGSLILVGPFVYGHKLFKAMNLLSEHYNKNG